MVATHRNTHLWSSSREEKRRHVPIVIECKVPMHRERKFMGVHKPKLMNGGEGKSGSKGSVLKDIESHQGEE